MGANWLEFDGIFRNAQIWVNHTLLARQEGDLREAAMAPELVAAEKNWLSLDTHGRLWLATSKGLAQWTQDHFAPASLAGFWPP